MTPEEQTIADQEAATAAAKEAEAKVLADKAKADADAKALHTRDEKQKAEYSLKKIAERLKTLGGDPDVILAGGAVVEDEDNIPLTMGKLKEIQRKEAQQTALQLADSLEDELERQEVKNLLQDRIKPSGDPKADLALARGAANAKKNALLAEELARKGQVNRGASGGTVPGKSDEAFEPNEQEKIFMSSPYNIPKEKILEARKKAEQKAK